MPAGNVQIKEQTMSVEQVPNKIKLVKLLSEDGKILEREGWMDFTSGVHDDDGSIYPAGFGEDGAAYGTQGDSNTGSILFKDGSETGYNLRKNYLSLVCLRVVHRDLQK